MTSKFPRLPKVHPIWLGNAGKIKQSCYLSRIEKSKVLTSISFPKKNYQLYFLLFTSFRNVVWKSDFWQIENYLKNVIRKFKKHEHCSALFQKNQSWDSVVSADFAALKNWVFSGDQSWISAVQRFFVTVQRWTPTGDLLSRADPLWKSLRLQPG